jgi:hypothetical protein
LHKRHYGGVQPVQLLFRSVHGFHFDTRSFLLRDPEILPKRRVRATPLPRLVCGMN